MATPISIVNGEYKKNAEAYTSAPGTVVDGDTIRVRKLSSTSTYNQTLTATLTVGSYSTNFSITTKPFVPEELVTFTFEVVIYPDFIDARYRALDSRPNSFRFLEAGVLLGSKKVTSDLVRGASMATYTVSVPAGTAVTTIESYMTASSITTATSKISRIYHNGTAIGASSRSFPVYPNNAQFSFTTDTAIAMPDIVNGDVIRLEHGNAPEVPNDLQSQDFISDCPEGFVGGTVTYTVPAGTYTAPTKEEANADALQDIEDNGQVFADDPANRNCTEEEPLPSFTFNTPWSFTDTGAGSINATRTYDQTSFPSTPTPAFWSVSAGGYGLRVNWEDSADCGGFNNKTQSATATVSINVTTPQNIQAIWEGIAEREQTTFEQMTIFIDGVEIGSATSPGGNLGCEMGAVVSTNLYPDGYPLTVGDHTISITASTNDPLFHVGSYYSFVFNRVDP